MGSTTKPLNELIKDLPPDMHTEVRDYIEFLLTKRRQRKNNTLEQDWAGALRDHRQRYTSLDLQRESFHWRGD